MERKVKWVAADEAMLLVASPAGVGRSLQDAFCAFGAKSVPNLETVSI